MKKALLAGLLVVLVVFVAAWWIFVRPWTAWPGPRAELDARWAEVEAWARNPAGASSPSETDRLLAEGVRKLDEPFEHLTPAADDSLPVLADPTGGTRAAIAAILTWHMQDVPLGSGCMADMQPRVPPIETLRAGRAALAFASAEPGDPRVDAVLHLASEMRRRGSLLEGMVGVRLAADAVATAKARGTRPNDAFLRWRPRKDEPFETVARDVVCGYRWLRGSLDTGNDEIFPPRPFLSRFVSLDREVLMVRTFHSELLHRAHPHREDPRALAAALRVDREDLPKSLLVRAFAADLGGPLEDWAGAIEQYDAFVGGTSGAPAAAR